MPSSLMSFLSDKEPTKGQNELMEKLVLEDGPEHMISVWHEHVKNAGDSEAGRGGGGSANAAGSTVGEGHSDLDSHVGRWRVSTDGRRHIESLAQGPA
jgi:hypothetical protein